MIDIALLIPVHPPKYQHIYHILSKILYAQIHHKFIDLILVFSNYNDYQKFEYKDAIIPIICDSAPYNMDGIVTFKKFYALNRLRYSQYEYLITCDSEIDLIIENFNLLNIRQKILELYNNQIIYAGEVKHDRTISDVIRHSTNLMNCAHDIEQLNKITDNYTLYHWWSDLPVYKTSVLQDFFNRINFNKHIRFYHFDHMIYLNYLALYHSFTFNNISQYLQYHWSLESLYTDSVDVLQLLEYHKYGFSWTIPSLFYRHKEFLLKKGTFLLYHTDRPTWQNICYNTHIINYYI